MALYIEPGTKTATVAGENILIKILTAREQIKFGRHLFRFNALVAGLDGEDVVPTERVFDAREEQYEMLSIGLTIDPDTVSVEHWKELLDHIAEVNHPSGDDAKN